MKKKHCTILYIINKIITNNEDCMFGLEWLCGVDLIKHAVEISQRYIVVSEDSERDLTLLCP